MSHSVIYNKIFGSDIFNRQMTPLPSQRPPRQSSTNSSSNIFNTSYIPQQNPKPIRQSLLIDKSDIFNTNPIPSKPKKIRNNSQSDIFFVEGKEVPSYDIYHPRIKYQSNYNPDKHIILNDSYKMKMKDMYGIDPNKSEKNITSSKGFCDYMDFKESKERSLKDIKSYAARSEAKEFYKTKLDEMEHNRIKQLSANPREQYMNDHLSNLFHDKDIDIKNKNIKPSEVPKEPKNTYHLTKPKNITNKNRWIAKLKWHNPQNEIIFKRYNNYNSERQTAYERKLNDLAGENNKTASPIHTSFRKVKNDKENDYIKPYIPGNINSSTKAKLSQNASNFNNDNFYEDNFKLKSLPESAIKEKTFTITNANNLDKKDLMRLFNNNGVHIYNIYENKGNILSDNHNTNKSYSFTIRDNNIDGKNTNFEKVSKQLQTKYKNIQIAPKHKICVNKKTSSITNNSNNNNIHSNNKIIKKTPNNHDINSSFSKQYNNINHSYKNLSSDRSSKK